MKWESVEIGMDILRTSIEREEKIYELFPRIEKKTN